MIRIGLTGRSGSGKGFLSEIFSEYGIPTIDTDSLYREMTVTPNSECICRLREKFGDGVLTSDGILNRASLADIVFSDREKLKLLNCLTHGLILEKTEELLKKYETEGISSVVIDAPLLYESGFNRICDYTVCAYTSDDILIKRITERDGITEDRARARLASQKSAEELVELSDYSIDTDKTKDELKTELQMILNNISGKEKQKK